MAAERTGDERASRPIRRRTPRCRWRSPARASTSWASRTTSSRGFSEEFLAGMAADASRSRRLGDVGANAPSEWAWGGRPDCVPHVLVMLYAREGGLEAWAEGGQGRRLGRGVQRPDPPRHLRHGRDRAVRLRRRAEPAAARLATRARPRRQGAGRVRQRGRAGRDRARLPQRVRPLHRAAADRPERAIAARSTCRRRRTRPTGATSGATAAIWCSASSIRTSAASGGSSTGRRTAVPQERWRLAEAMVGRTRTGTPLVPLTHEPIEGVGPALEEVAANHFTYAADPDGLRCPIGAHIRRANPRTGDLPAGTRGLIARLLRMLGFKRSSFRDDLVASTRFHRLLRRGREYGTELSPEDALSRNGGRRTRGLHFICLVANISRQFEFVQNAWIQSTKFAGLSDESDPLLGSRALFRTSQTPRPRGCFAAWPRRATAPRQPRLACRNSATGVFSMPRPGLPARRIEGLPQFVTVAAAPISSCPGIRALRYIAGAPSTAPIATPIPPAPSLGRWQTPLRVLHRALESAACMSSAASSRSSARRFNRVFREPLAALDPVSDQPPAAERRPEARRGADLPGRGGEPPVDHRELRRLHAADLPARPVRARRQHQDPRHRQGRGRSSATTCRSTCAAASSRRRAPSRPTSATPGPGPNLPRRHRGRRLRQHGDQAHGRARARSSCDDEKHTQDMIGVSTPTFVTPNTRENAKLQIWSFRDMPVFYFLNPLDPHLLDFFMQSLWNETQYNPLGARYWSCVPYLLGEGQAMMYSFLPKSKVITDIPGVPFGRVPPNYLRDNMVATLARAGRRVRPPGPGPDRPAPDADRERLGALAGKALAVRAGGDGPHPAPAVRHAGARRRSPGGCRSTPGTACPSTARSATRAARAGACIRSSRACARSMNQTPHIEPTGDEVFD